MRRPQKTCAICESGVRVVDYKDERTLSRFLTERGKILPEPALRDLRPAPAAAQHRHQAGSAAGAAALHQGLRRLTRDLRGSRGSRAAAGARCWSWSGYLLVRAAGVPLRTARGAAPPVAARHRARVGLACWARWAGPHSGCSTPGGLGAQFARAAAVLVIRLLPGADAVASVEPGCAAPSLATGVAGARAGGAGCGISGSAGPQFSGQSKQTYGRVYQTAMRRDAVARPAERPELSTQMSPMAARSSLLYPGLLALAGDRRDCAWRGPGITGIAERPAGRAAGAASPASGSTISWSGAGCSGWRSACCPAARGLRLVGANVLLVWACSMLLAGWPSFVRRAGRVPPGSWRRWR